MEISLYIERWWKEYVGGTDDTCSLIDYLTNREFRHDSTVEIQLTKILQDFQLTATREIEEIRQTIDIYYVFGEGFQLDIHCAINLLMDVTAILLECQKNGQVRMLDLDHTYKDESAIIAIKAESEDVMLLKNWMADFIQNPLRYDLAEFCPEEEMQEIATQCQAIVAELTIDEERHYE